jgi:hypothetical protein
MLDRQTASSGTICVFVTPATSTRTRIATHRAVPIWLCFSHAPTSFALDYHGQAQLQSFKSSIVLLAPFSLHQLPGTSKSIAPVGSSHLGLIIPQCSRLCLRTRSYDSGRTLMKDLFATGQSARESTASLLISQGSTTDSPSACTVAL